MCTVSLIRSPARDPFFLRVAVNRDELRDRASALAPVSVNAGAARALMPVDPQGGGTWVAATDAGLVFALLNGPGENGAVGSRPFASRGNIIPRLVDSLSLEEALERVLAMDVSRYRPWRLIVADTRSFADVDARANGRVRYMKGPLPMRLMATSSSVRHREAVEHRTALFREIVAPADARTQDAFHAHRLADEPGLGVLMERQEARTVSRTIVEVSGGRVSMRYQPLTSLVSGQTATVASLVLATPQRGAA